VAPGALELLDTAEQVAAGRTLWHGGTAAILPHNHGENRQTAARRGPPSKEVAARLSWTDEELVARSIEGDLESFNQLVIRWERPIFALAYRVIGREEDARDVCQETFLRAFRAIKGFKGQAKFSSWLYRIALNLCRDWIRRERRAPLVQVPEGLDPMDLANELPSQAESLDDTVSRREMSSAVARAMASLPEEQRTAIILKEYHGLTFQEIADLLGCPLSTVKTRLYQGLAVLRRHLEKQAPPAPVMVNRP
jgi:RNA polymerase sigma-70 factor (ECF subfamily)